MFIDSVHFLNNSLNNLVKHLRENDFYHLSQEFNANALVLLKKNRFFTCDNRNSLGKFRKGLPSKDEILNDIKVRVFFDKNIEQKALVPS